MTPDQTWNQSAMQPGGGQPAGGFMGQQPGGPPAQPEPTIGPQPKEPTPLDPPKVYVNLKWRVPPLVVKTQEDADALDPNEWHEQPPQAQPAGQQAPAKDEYPKLYFNVNVVPKVVGSADEEKSLGSEWQPFQFTQSLLDAAQANLKAAAAKRAAKDAAKQSAGGPGGAAGYGQQPQYPGYGQQPQYPGQSYGQQTWAPPQSTGD